MSNQPTKLMKTRLGIGVFSVLVLFAAYVTFKVFEAAIINEEYYKGKANAQQLDTTVINADRGTVYDTNGKILAQSNTAWDVDISPNTIESNRTHYQRVRARRALAEYEKAVKDGAVNLTPPSPNAIYDEAEEIASALSEILGVDKQKILDMCANTEMRHVYVMRKVDKEQYDQIIDFKSNKLIGEFSLNLTKNSKRDYPNGTLAANVIGFTNFENEGIYGIEAYYDEYLQGVNGKEERATDVSGNPMPYAFKANFPAQEGNALYLTIDEVLQFYLEKHLETTVSQHKVNNRATGIIMSPKTGAVLAMATYPSYNLNEPGQLSPQAQEQVDAMRKQLVADAATSKGFLIIDDESLLNEHEIEFIDGEINALDSVLRETQWKNKAVSELYFPGSVFKVITTAAALEEHTVSQGSHFFCSGSRTIADTTISCWLTSGHGGLNLLQSITKSCNPAFMDIGASLGKHKFSDYLESFGLTVKTGIDLPGEATSLYMPRERMGPVELASCSFGQTNKLTPIQVITAFAATINGGYLVTPYVVDKIVDNNSNIVKSAEPVVKRQVVSGATSDQMKDLLEQVVRANGGSNAYIAGYRIGGKSGTTEKLDELEKNNGEMRFVSTFCAFTPADDPEIIMLVCVDEPLSGTFYGSAVAAPVVSNVFRESLSYLEIYPHYTAEEQAAQEIAVPHLRGLSAIDASTSLNVVGLKAEFIGERTGGSVQFTVPQAGQKISRDGTVVVYLAEQDYIMSIVPSVIGMSILEANNAITNAGLNISLTGGAIENQYAKATAQSLEPFTSVASGTVVEVTFTVTEEGY
ncbi:MAG: penicillin-binding transpeptidase domain-containing protein [Oscillospiraceae bacterium]|nr:penicillin-binding transpeptidase domain-containing protein [Oscillospiraceae bacterium]